MTENLWNLPEVPQGQGKQNQLFNGSDWRKTAIAYSDPLELNPFNKLPTCEKYTHACTRTHMINFGSSHWQHDYKQITGHPKNMVSSIHKALDESSNTTSHPMEQSFLLHYGQGKMTK